MSKIHPILEAFLEPGDSNVKNMKIPKAFVEKMLETNTRLSTERGIEMSLKKSFADCLQMI